MLTRRLSLLAITAAIAGILFINVPATQATECSSTLKDADTKHKQAVQQYQPGTDEYLAALYKIEDELFSAMKRCQNDSEVVSAMGELQLSLGQIPIATLYGQKAIQMNNDNWQAHYVLGSALNLQKKYTEGLAHLKIASGLQPQNYSLLVNLCSSYEKNKQFSEAIKTCSAAIKKGPYNIHGTAYYLRALAYTGNNELALADKDNKLAKEFGVKK
ncbi:MAG: hypothetical protein KAT25_04905 [Sulfuriflexus sp.]|nr:hypothetical protein [Sulfuriflexus sp.]